MSDQLVVVAGQSNALGFGVTAAELPVGYTPSARIQIWVNDHFEVMRPGENTGTPANPGAWGPEVGFSARWLEDHASGTLYVVKSVKGSTGLESDPTQLDWSPASRGELWDATTAKVLQAEAATGLAVSKVLWMQGEQDAIDLMKAVHYRQNLSDLFVHMKTEWGAGEITYGQIGDHAGLAYDWLVRAAQKVVSLGDYDATMIDTSPLSYQADGLHLSGSGELALGSAMYDPPPRLECGFISQHGWFL